MPELYLDRFSWIYDGSYASSVRQKYSAMLAYLDMARHASTPRHHASSPTGNRIRDPPSPTQCPMPSALRWTRVTFPDPPLPDPLPDLLPDPPVPAR